MHKFLYDNAYVISIMMAIILELFDVKIWFKHHFPYGHILLIGFLVSFILTPEIREFAKKVNILDHPGGRKIQKEAVPLLGGVAIYAAFSLAIIQTLDFTLAMKGICIGATMIFIIGILDDTIGLMAKTKLLGQIIAVLIMTNMGYWGGTEKQFIIIIWVIGITNAFNFLDGMDGLAAGLGAISAIYFTILAVITHQQAIAIISVALAGACLGFLIYNFSPASIYMGDTGSTLIGFLLASISMVGGWYQDEKQIIVSLSVPVLILGVLIFDMIMTSILRFIEGKVKTIPELLAYAGRDHIHHRIQKSGISSVNTVLFIYIISALSGLLAFFVRSMDNFSRIITLILVFIIVVLAIIKMYKIEKKYK